MATSTTSTPNRLRSFLRRTGGLYKGHVKLSGLRGAARLTVALGMTRFAGWYAGSGRNRRSCPCCGWTGRNFLPYIAGGYVTFQAACPGCGWHGRHRGHRLFYDRVLRMMQRRGRLLYFSPEHSILEYLRRNPDLEIKTSDFGSTSTDFDLDVMNIPFGDDTWDLILCHRVIEHVPDDRRGMRELHRILKPSGALVLSVPISRSVTIEYGEPNPLEDDHYYAYGPDFADRIPSGFRTRRYAFSELFSAEEFDRLALIEDYVFVCEKAGRASPGLRS